MALIIEERGKKRLSKDINLMVKKCAYLTKKPFIYLLEKAFKSFILGPIGTNNKNKICFENISVFYIKGKWKKRWKSCIRFSFYSMIRVPLRNFTRVIFVIKIHVWKNKIFSAIFNDFIFKSEEKGISKRVFCFFFENPLNHIIKKVLCFFYTFFLNH